MYVLRLDCKWRKHVLCLVEDIEKWQILSFEVEICSWSFHIGRVLPDTWTRKGHSTCLLEQGRPEALVPFGIVKKEGRGRKGGRMENEILSWSISLFQKRVKLPVPPFCSPVPILFSLLRLRVLVTRLK